MNGPPVRFVPCTPEEAIHEADAQVDRLLGEGWAPGQIALLVVTGKRHHQQKEILDYHGWDGHWDAFFAAEDVFYGHVLGFKRTRTAGCRPRCQRHTRRKPPASTSTSACPGHRAALSSAATSTASAP